MTEVFVRCAHKNCEFAEMVDIHEVILSISVGRTRLLDGEPSEIVFLEHHEKSRENGMHGHTEFEVFKGNVRIGKLVGNSWFTEFQREPDQTENFR